MALHELIRSGGVSGFSLACPRCASPIELERVGMNLIESSFRNQPLLVLQHWRPLLIGVVLWLCSQHGLNTKPFATEPQNKKDKLTRQATGIAQHLASEDDCIRNCSANAEVLAWIGGRIPSFQFLQEASHGNAMCTGLSMNPRPSCWTGWACKALSLPRAFADIHVGRSFIQLRPEGSWVGTFEAVIMAGGLVQCPERRHGRGGRVHVKTRASN